MEKITEITVKQLEERAKGLKWEMEKALDEKVESLKGQLQLLEEVKVPSDILKLYLENDGKVWVSKRVSLTEGGRFDLVSSGGRNLFYPKPDSREPDFQLPTGIYRLVLMAIPTEIEESQLCDDYGILIER